MRNGTRLVNSLCSIWDSTRHGTRLKFDMMTEHTATIANAVTNLHLLLLLSLLLLLLDCSLLLALLLLMMLSVHRVLRRRA